MIIKLKWLWKKKKDEDQTVIRNKAQLVAKVYAQEEGMDKSKITRKQSKASKHGHENQKSSKKKKSEEYKAEARKAQNLCPLLFYEATRANLAIPESQL
ncbi:hypothetical protein Tco_0219758 [Tanacetum coccineum]